MKKILLFATMVALSLAVAMPVNAQSRKDKKAAEKAAWERKQKQKEEEETLLWQIHMDSIRNAQEAIDAAGVEINIPCIESSYDDEEYFRDLGIGRVESNNKQAARLDAVNQAKDMIKARLGEFVKGITSDYFNSYAGSKEADDVQHKMESKLNGVVEYMLNNADKECEEAFRDKKGNWEYYYVIRIPKGELKKQMMDAAKQEKTEIDFNEYRMQKFMDENMDKMLKDKKEAGY